MNDGYIKLHRKFTDWEWSRYPYVSHLFIHLLISANYKDGRWKGYDIKRGQLITGRHELSRVTGLSEQQIRTCIKKLKSTSEITVNPTNRFSVITIVNYDKYQLSGNEQPANQPASEPTTNQQLTTNKKNKKNKKYKETNIPTFSLDEFPYLSDSKFKQSFDEFVNSRKENRQKMTDYSKMLVLKKLHKVHILKAVRMLEKSIERGWRGVFDLKPEECTDIDQALDQQRSIQENKEKFDPERIASNTKALDKMRKDLVEKYKIK